MNGLREMIEVQWDMMNDEIDPCDECDECRYEDGICLDCGQEEEE